jgi:hypothetical protein
LHLVCTLHGLPLGWALVGAKTDERDVQEDLLATTPALTRPEGQRRTIIADKAYYGRQFEAHLDHNGIDLLRPAALARNPKPQPDCSTPTATHRIGRRYLNGQLDLELPGGRTITGVRVRIARRILALVAAI